MFLPKMENLQAKHVGTFNANRSRQSSLRSFLLPKNMTDLVSVYFNELFGLKCFLSRHPELTRKSDEDTNRDFLFLLGDSGSILNSAQQLALIYSSPAPQIAGIGLRMTF